MIDQKSIYSQLISVGSRHPEITQKFAKFSDLIQEEFTAENILIEGILFMPYPTAELFSVLFANTTIIFALSISIPDDGAVLGQVTCFSERHFPKKELKEIGRFTFDANGETSQRDAQHGDPLCLDHLDGASMIATHYLCLALSDY